MNGKIRVATLDDALTNNAMYSRAFECDYSIAKTRERLMMLDGYFFVLLLDGKIVGAAIANVLRNSIMGNIAGVAIEPELHGFGYGRQLMEHLISFLEGLNVEKIKLTVAPHNLPGNTLYKSLGFSEINFIPDCYGPGEDRRIMLRVSK